MRLSLLAGASVLLITGCSRSQPPDTRADEATLREYICAANWVIGKDDEEKWMSFFADDARVYFPESPMLRTSDIRAAAGNMLKDPNFAFRGTTTALEVAPTGDLAYCEGAYVYNSTDPTTNSLRAETGFWVSIFKKRDGQWKIVSDMHVLDRPVL
jgi:ketosteroid isomerase-like protein